MTKKIILVLMIACFIACTPSKGKTKPNDLIRLKLTNIDGYGNFDKKFRLLSWTPLREGSPWKNTEIKTTGIPENWTKFNVNQVWFDANQFVYQNYKQGNLNEKVFKTLLNVWKIDLNKRKLSEKPIHCFVHIAIGKNENDKLEYIIDTDNDRDFSDEVVEKPILKTDNLDNDEILKNSKSVVAEISTNNGIKRKKVKIVVLLNNDGNLVYNFPYFAKTTFLETDIHVSNGFSDITFDEKSLIQFDKKNKELTRLNEFIEIKNNRYKNLGVDINSNELLLLRMPKDTVLYSTKVGYNAIPFSVKQLDSNDSLKLSSFNKKLLYLEFWGSWCVPCIKEIPNLKRAYEKTNREDIEFLGVAVFDTKEKLKKAILNYGINWPQVLNSDSNKLKESYNITGFPASFLIDKKGKIIAKNLRGDKLLDTLNYYLKR